MAAQPIAPESAGVSVELTDFASRYENSQFIADEVVPIIGVNAETGPYPKRQRRDQATIVNDYVGHRGQIPEVTYDVDEGQYLVKGRGLQAAVSESLALSANPALTVQQSAVQRAMQGVKLAREDRVATLLLTQANWAAGNTAAVSNYWTNTTTGTPVADMKTALQAIPFNGDDVVVYGVCSDVVFDTLQLHPDIKDLRGGGDTKGGLVAAQQIADGVGFNKLLVSKVHKLSSARGLATETYARIWGTTGFVFVVVPKGTPDPHSTIFGATFRFNLPGSVNGVRVREWNVPGEGIGGTDHVACELKDDERVIQNDAGYFLRGVRAS